MIQFYETRMGAKFFNADVPNLINELKKINQNMQALSMEISKLNVAPKTINNPWYFTFGSSKKFPYQNTYLIVMASSETEALLKFSKKHPNPARGLVNCAFWYSRKWWDMNPQYEGTDPAEIIGSDESGLLTWDDIYTLAKDSVFGSTNLKRKDSARGNVRTFALGYGLSDPEDAEVPEDAIEDYCDRCRILFNASGDIKKANGTEFIFRED